MTEKGYSSRPDIDTYWLNLVKGVSLRATCPRRQVGAIITDPEGRILASGYNGPPSGIPNCIETSCGAEHDEPGQSDRCFAIHAEQNAILQLGDRITRASTLYCTTKPCFTCAKLICQTSITRIIYIDDYPDQRSEILFNLKAICLTQLNY